MLAYIGRRILTLIPMWFALSAVIFGLIELPPGDFADREILLMRTQGVSVTEEMEEEVRHNYGLDRPIYVRYWTWIKRALLRGDLSMSLQFQKPNAEILRERVPVTLAISVSSLLISWAIAIPIGIYSATHQYSLMDYVFTIVGFFGLGTPGFLVAMLIAWVSLSMFSFSPLGLNSVEYVNQPWSWAKGVDMLKHLWFPVLLTGLTSTGYTIRTMRNNLLDQLRRQYVITARAKGLPERVVLLKYPVRLAINPIISSVGFILPQLFAGAGLISIVLSLPTVGPLLFIALHEQDMYLAGTILMIYTSLILGGTLISDILLAWVDPRIRYGGGMR